MKIFNISGKHFYYFLQLPKMSLNLISKLKTLIEKGGNKDRIGAYEDVIADEIEEYIKEEHFY